MAALSASQLSARSVSLFYLPLICLSNNSKYSKSISLHVLLYIVREERQIGRQTDRQTDRQIDRQTERETERDRDRQTERDRDRQTDRQADRQKQR